MAKPSPATNGAERHLEPELTRLAALVDRAGTGRLGLLTDAELLELSRLYRYAATRVSQYATEGRSPEAVARVAALTTRAHALLAAPPRRASEPWHRRAARHYLVDVPRAIRAEWKILAASFLILYGLAAVSWYAVARDLDDAWALFSPEAVAVEIRQLEETKPGEPFRGNFTFGLDESSRTAGMIMTHNMGVGVLFFASALVPPLYVLLLATNGLMVGTYTGVAGHYGQAGNILSILMCHGTIELQAFVIAGAAGLALLRAWIAPGPWSRRHALRLESRRGWLLLSAVFPMLFVAGLIEGFVSPHAPTNARLAVAVGTGILLIAWIVFSGRSEPRRA